MSEKTVSQELAEVLNRHSLERSSNTPDFIIAAFLLRCLEAVEGFTVEREGWYGVKLQPNQKGRTFQKREFPKVQRLIDYATKKAEELSLVGGGEVYAEYIRVAMEAQQELDEREKAVNSGGQSKS